MEETKIQLQQKIIDFTKRAYDMTKKCVEHCQADNADEVVTLIEDREKILNIIESLQVKLSTHEKEDYDEEYNQYLSKIVQSIIKKDEFITDSLSKTKKNIKSEIAKVYQNKENFRGYNLNNLK